MAHTTHIWHLGEPERHHGYFLRTDRCTNGCGWERKMMLQKQKGTKVLKQDVIEFSKEVGSLVTTIDTLPACEPHSHSIEPNELEQVTFEFE